MSKKTVTDESDQGYYYICEQNIAETYEKQYNELEKKLKKIDIQLDNELYKEIEKQSGRISIGLR